MRSAILAVLLLAHAGHAASIKPSTLVTLRQGNGTCVCGFMGQTIDVQIKPDGTNVPFVIPPGQVLLLDAWTWDLFSAPTAAGTNVAVSLCVGSSVYWVSFGVTDGAVAAGGGPLPNLVVTGDTPLCIGTYYGGTALGNVHGVLVKNK